MGKQSYKERVIEQIMMKVNEAVSYSVNGECGGRTCEDCKNELRDFISKALEGQAEIIYREWASYLPEQAAKELLESKGLI